jgi:hypothetical protein
MVSIAHFKQLKGVQPQLMLEVVAHVRRRGSFLKIIAWEDYSLQS